MNLQTLIETQQLAKKLLREHGLDDWTFKFSNKKTAVGTCYHGRKLIEVSKHYIESHPDEIRDTILHEIAHALVGPNHGHDWVWRSKCLEVGANPSRTTDSAVFSGSYNYTIGCNNDDCRGWNVKRHRVKSALFSRHCRLCGGPLFVYNHKTGEIQYTSPSEDWAEV